MTQHASNLAAHQRRRQRGGLAATWRVSANQRRRRRRVAAKSSSVAKPIAVAMAYYLGGWLLWRLNTMQPSRRDLTG